VPPPVSGSEVVLGPIEGPAGTPGTSEGESASDGDGGPGGGFGAGFVGLVDTSALGSDPLIEEPVASGGDSSLWADDGDDDDEDDDEDEDEGGDEQ
jgi:hypothetical protein